MKMKILIALAGAMFLAACTSTPKVPDNGAYEKKILPDRTVVETTRSAYAIQADDKRDERAAQKPIFEIEALPGQSIELKGVKRMAVYAPANLANGGQLPPPTRAATGWEVALNVADRTLDRALQFFGIYTNRQVQIRQIDATRDIALSRDASTVEMVDRIGQTNARIAGFIVPTGPNVNTYNFGRDGNVGSGTQQNQNNPIAVNCSSGPGAAGGGATGGTALDPATGGDATGGNAAGSGTVPCTVTK